MAGICQRDYCVFVGPGLFGLEGKKKKKIAGFPVPSDM